MRSNAYILTLLAALNSTIASATDDPPLPIAYGKSRTPESWEIRDSPLPELERFGGTTCEGWTVGKAAGGYRYNAVHSDMIGYVSGYLMGSRQDIFGGGNLSTIEPWVDAYCKLHKDEALYDALYKMLEKLRVQHEIRQQPKR